MSDDTDDDLNHLDLHAWEPPPVPRGIADAAIARAMATDEAIAVTVRRRKRRYALVGAGIATALAASVALWLGVHGPATGAAESDEIVTAAGTRRHVVLGESSADLDPGTTIRTQRAGGALHVVQSGTATWSVAAHDQIVIDAGSSASIEATGASLRVETTMTPSDIRIASGIALTAAAAALLTVTVYEGHVKATSGGQTVIVGPQERLVLQQNRAEKGLEQIVELESAVQALKRSPAVGAGSYALAVKGHADIAIAAGESARIEAAGSLTTPEAVVEIAAPCELRVEYRSVAAADDAERVMGIGNSSAGFVDIAFAPGTYTYRATCTGGPDLHGTLAVVADTCRRSYCVDEDTRLLKLDAPEDSFIAFVPPTLHVAGTVADGATLSIGAQSIPIAANHTFSIDLAYSAGQSLALRVDHPTRGTQFFVQHSASVGPASVRATTPGH